MSRRRILALALLLGSQAALASRLPGAQALPQGVDTRANVILRPEALSAFFNALNGVSPASGVRGRTVVLHLGDSHLQSDLLSRPLRLDLQRRFGDAGRGLVFPYSVARTTEGDDLRDESNAPWVVRRSAVKAPKGWEGLDAGVSGYALLTQSPDFVLRMGLGEGQTFDQVTLFRRRDAAARGLTLSLHADAKVLERAGLIPRDVLVTVKPGDNLYRIAKANGTSFQELMRLNHMEDSRIWPGDAIVVARRKVPAPDAAVPQGFEDVARFPAGAAEALSETVRLPRAVSDLFLRASQDPGGTEAVLDGLVLERAGAPGVLYDAAGVNGAQARSFLRSPRFLAEARSLTPDLIILSFGTNEADGGAGDASEAGRWVAALAEALTQGPGPRPAVLVTTPPDGLDWKGRYNPNTARVAESLREAAAERGFALWDWNTVMGGEHRAKQWRKLGLMQADGVHLTAAGYRIEEQLLWQALTGAYERF